MMNIIFSEYFQYKVRLRGFHLETIEHIVRYSSERYYDTVTQRLIVVGRHDEQLVMIPYEQHEESLQPVTVHVVTRQQIKYRFQTGRLVFL